MLEVYNTTEQAKAISLRQTERNQLATQIAYAAGLRAHELLTLAKSDECRLAP